MDRRLARVIHAVPTWLPQTATWLHTQIRSLPDTIESHVFAEAVKNLDQFPIERLRSLEAQPRWRSTADRLVRKLGLRHHLAALDRYASEVEPDLLHSHFGPVAWRNLAVARRHGLRHVVTFYGYDVNRLVVQEPVWRDRYRELFDQADLFLCEGPFMAQCLRELGCPAEKVRVHHLGVEVDAFEYRPRRWQPGESLRVLLSGTIREKKGFTYAIDAIAAVARDVDVEVTLIGDATHEPRDQIEKRLVLSRIEEHGLQSRVRLLGYQPYERLIAEAYEHHVFLSPSVVASDGDTEGGAPVTLIEMAATGMPIVSTFHCDIPNVVLHAETGRLVPERSADGITAQLRALLSSPGDWESMTAAGRARMEQSFDARRQGEALGTIYANVLKRPDAVDVPVPVHGPRYL